MAPTRPLIVIVAFTCKTVVGENVTVIVFVEQGKDELCAIFLIQKLGALTLNGRESLNDILHKQHGLSEEIFIDSGPGLRPLVYWKLDVAYDGIPVMLLTAGRDSIFIDIGPSCPSGIDVPLPDKGLVT